jgi:hypothetical protein
MSWRDFLNADGVAVFKFDHCDDFSAWRFEDGDEAVAAAAGVSLLGDEWQHGEVRGVEDGRRLADVLREWADDRLDEARSATDDGRALVLFRAADEAVMLAEAVFVSDWAVCDDLTIAADEWAFEVRAALRSWGDEFGLVAVSDDDNGYFYDGWYRDGDDLVSRFERWLGDAGDRLRVTLTDADCWSSCSGSAREFECSRPASPDQAEIVARLVEDESELSSQEIVGAARLLASALEVATPQP